MLETSNRCTVWCLVQVVLGGGLVRYSKDCWFTCFQGESEMSRLVGWSDELTTNSIGGMGLSLAGSLSC